MDLPLFNTSVSLTKSPNASVDIGNPYVSGSYVDELAEEEMYAASDQSRLIRDDIMVTSPSSDTEVKLSIRQKTNLNSLNRPSMQAVALWLKENYEEHCGCNTSRENLFYEYSQFAQSQGYPIMNSASFGKLIRAVFPSIQTRRLGVRGQSKYHYNGIRPKFSNGKDYLIDVPVQRNGYEHSSPVLLLSSPSKRARNDKTSVENDIRLEINLAAFPPVPEQIISDSNFPASSSQVQMLITSYQEHCNAIARLINENSAEKIEMALTDFWHNLSSTVADLLGSPYMAKYMCDCDIYLYSAVLNALHSDSFSLNEEEYRQYDLLVTFFDKWVSMALKKQPEMIKVTKTQVAKCFTLSLHRATSLLKSMSQTRALLSSDYLLQQMVTDWSKLDTENINEYVCWSCQWQADFLFAVENDIVSLLHRKASITNWTTWLNSLIQRSVNFPMLHESYDLAVAEHNSKQFVAKFAFLTAQILRDIAIRSVSSFGSYHTLRLFLDEYIWYMVTKNLSILKINHLAKLGNYCSAWTNGILFYYLEQRHFFGPKNDDNEVTVALGNDGVERIRNSSFTQHSSTSPLPAAVSMMNVIMPPSVITRNPSMESIAQQYGLISDES